jgi:hypothetical protein
LVGWLVGGPEAQDRCRLYYLIRTGPGSSTVYRSSRHPSQSLNPTLVGVALCRGKRMVERRCTTWAGAWVHGQLRSSCGRGSCLGWVTIGSSKCGNLLFRLVRPRPLHRNAAAVAVQERRERQAAVACTTGSLSWVGHSDSFTMRRS